MAERRKKDATSTSKESKRDEQKNGNGEKPTETGLTVRPTQEMTEWTPRFAMTVDQAVELEQQKQEFMQRVLKEDFHYGKIPGAGQRKVLFKAGAEALCAAMRLHPELSDAEPPEVDETGEHHNGEPYWSFRRVCRMYVQTGPGPDDRMLVAQAEGSCNSFEVKYRYRESAPACPVCGARALRRNRPAKDKPKAPVGGYCWAKLGGCGANFQWNDTDFQTAIKAGVKRIPNPDVMDAANTGLKMADKRALVATTLIATGFSTDFTQDLEDRVSDDGAGYAESYGGGGADDTQDSTSTTNPAAPASKVSGSAQAAPPPPKEPERELTEEERAQRLMRQVVTSLGNTLTPQWPKERYAEAFTAMGQSVPKVVGLLVELHDHQHGQCEHIQTIPSAVDYMYPATDEERAYVTTVKGELIMPAVEAKDPDPDDIPF